MKSTRVDADGTVRCPNCGSTSFRSQRSMKAKLIGVPTIGVGTFAAPKRLKCNGCGEYLKASGGTPARPRSNHRPSGVVAQTPEEANLHFEFIKQLGRVDDKLRRGEITEEEHAAERGVIQQEETVQMAALRGEEPPAPVGAPEEVSIVDRLAKLDSLLAAQVITAVEHTNRRAEILRDI